jgi:hypothetical protein
MSGFTNPFQNAVDQNYTTGWGAGSNCYTADGGATWYSSVAGWVVNSYIDANGIIYDVVFLATTADQGPITLSGGTYNWTKAIRSNSPANFMYANVKAYGATGDGVTDDTAAFTAARAAHSILYVPDGVYVLLNFALTSNTTIICQSWNTIFLQIPNAGGGQFIMGVNIGNGGSSDPTNNIKNITIKNGQFRGRIDTEVFAEQTHLVSLSGASFVTFENCLFYKFKGDGLYIGSTNDDTAERHNEDITIRNCWFDGFNSNNRNAISVIDGTRVYIQQSTFERCTNSSMPGAIDLEPNISHRYFRIRDIFIERCTFQNMPTAQNSIAIPLFSDVGNPITPYNNIQIRGCEFKNTASFGIAMQYKPATGVVDADSSINILIENNIFDGNSTPLFIGGIKGVKIHHNTFVNQLSAISIGSTAGIQIMDIEFWKNTFLAGQTGSSGFVLSVKSNNINLTIDDNEFIDVGRPNSTANGVCIQWNGGVGITSTRQKIRRNKMTTPTSRTIQAFSVAAATFIDTDHQDNEIKCPTGSILYGRGARVTAIPVAGTFIQGDTLIKSNPVEQGAATAKYVTFGWVRVTSSAANVLGTDWMEQRALTGN